MSLTESVTIIAELQSPAPIGQIILELASHWLVFSLQGHCHRRSELVKIATKEVFRFTLHIKYSDLDTWKKDKMYQ